jgi:arsenate reductase (glutaredoxin)
MTTLFHNPNCGTSRNVLATLRAGGETPEVVDYVKAGWTRPQLEKLLKDAGLSARQALRTKGDLVAELGLLGEEVPNSRILDAMVAHPVLVERPFVVTAKGTALCRPADKVLALMDRPPPAVVKA